MRRVGLKQALEDAQAKAEWQQKERMYQERERALVKQTELLQKRALVKVVTMLL